MAHDKAKDRAYYQKNRDAILRRVAKWVRENPERVRQTGRRYYLQNRGKILAKQKQDQLADPTKIKRSWRKQNLRRKYGLTLDQYNALLAEQYNSCALCQESFRADKKPVVDHDHVTGRVRGILCQKCNMVLGFSGDSVERLQSAIEYLRKSR